MGYPKKLFDEHVLPCFAESRKKTFSLPHYFISIIEREIKVSIIIIITYK